MRRRKHERHFCSGALKDMTIITVSVMFGWGRSVLIHVMFSGKLTLVVNSFPLYLSYFIRDFPNMTLR